MQATEHIQRAARKLNLVGIGQTVDGPVAAELFDELNRMLRQWRAERIFSSAWVRTGYPLVASTRSYTIGPTGDFVQNVRPMAIHRAYVTPVGSTADIPVGVLTRREYDDIPIKTTESAFPYALHYEKGDGPNGTIEVYPVPTTPATLRIAERTAISEFATMTTDLDFTEGADLAIELNLAVAYAPSIPRAVSKELADQAYWAKQAWLSSNRADEDVDVPRLNPWGYAQGLQGRRRSIRDGVV